MTTLGTESAAADGAARASHVVRSRAVELSEAEGAAPSVDAWEIGDAAFHLDRVTHTYARGVRALDDVSLAIPRCCHTVLVGPSGSGKTTLLGCLSGRLTPSAGTLVRSGPIATIYQDLRLVAERSVLGNVLDGALGRVGLMHSLLGMPAEEKAAALALIQRVGLEHRAKLAVAHLSGGERQRVAIARALMQKPAVILADEPVCSLDRENAESVMELLKSVCAERHITLVSVLHDEGLAARYADRRYCLKAGRLVGALGRAGSERVPAFRDDDRPAARVDLSLVEACSCGAGGDAERRRCARAQAEPALPMLALNKPAWMHPVALLFIGLLAMGAYGWSVVSLGLHQANGRSVAKGLSSFLRDLVPSSWSQLAAIPWLTLMGSLIETLQMSLIGTTAGVLLAYPLAALAARNSGPRLIRGSVRQLLNAIRTVPSLIWALFFVAAVGFGQLAGVLALSLYSVGYLTKFFYESFENTAKGAPEALREIGANGPQRFVRAIAPSSRAAAIAATLFMLEYNVRSASVLGVVDAGGIGYYIKFYLDMRMFPAAVACLALIFVVVVVLDAVSQRVRHRLIAD